MEHEDRIYEVVNRIEDKLDRHIEKNHVSQGQLFGYLSILSAVFLGILTVA